MAEPSVATPTRVRYGVLVFACTLAGITYLDRLCFGSAQAQIRDTLGLSSVDQLSGAWLLLTGQITEQRKGNKIIFTIEPIVQPTDRSRKPNPKEASRPRSVGPDYGRTPARRVTGPMNVYYYDYVVDHTTPEERRIVDRIGARESGDIILYEILNLVDGKRTVQAIRDYVAAAYGPIPIEDVSEYLRLLEKIGVVKMDR